MKKLTWAIVLVGLFPFVYYGYGAVSDPAPSQLDAEQNGNDPAEVYKSNSEKAMEGTEVGNTAPDFELAMTDGEKVKLSDYRGKKVMLNFWATWCPPCREEIPDMQQFYDEKEIVILAVNLTHTEARKKNVTAFLKEFDVSFPVLLDETAEVSNLYRIQPIPTTYMIDTEGKIRYKAFGAMTYEQMVSEFEKMK